MHDAAERSIGDEPHRRGGGFTVTQSEADDTASATADGAESVEAAESDENLIEPNTEAESASEETAQNEADLGMSEGSSEASIPAAMERVDEDVTLMTRTVAQAESIRSYFLAQTLESTRTVPIVSANLPLDTGMVEEVVEPAESEGSDEEEGDGSDDSDPDLAAESDQSVISTEASDSERSGEISSASTVVGSFTYRGITFAVEPGGESVAIVAADYTKLPEEYIEAHAIVLPSMVSLDGTDYYTVSRIADYAFASLTSAIASQDESVGRGPAPANEEEEIEDNAQASAESSTLDLSNGASEDAVASEDSESADADSDIQAQAEACAYGITAITIPASITSIGDGAFTGFDTLQYVVVSEDNPNYSMYDGVLYDIDQTSLLLIPEGRLGAVRVPSTATNITENVSSHCAFITSFVVEPDSAASQLLAENDLHNANGDKIEVVIATEAEANEDAPLLAATYDRNITLEAGETLDMLDELNIPSSDADQVRVLTSNDFLTVSAEDQIEPVGNGVAESVVIASDAEGDRAFTAFSLAASGFADEVELVAEEQGESLETSVVDFIEMERQTVAADVTEVVDLPSDTVYGKQYTNAKLAVRWPAPTTETTNILNTYNSKGFDGTITWTGGEASGPKEGSVVTVTATRYKPTSCIPGSKDALVYVSLKDWKGASETKKLIGFKNPETGSFLDLDSIFDKNGFSFSFVWREDFCTLNDSGLAVLQGADALIPVCETVSGMVVMYYKLNSGYLETPATGASSRIGEVVAVYSKVGEPVMQPTAAAKRTDGYSFTKWTDQWGDVPPEITTADLSGREYNAEWETTGGTLNVKNFSIGINWPEPAPAGYGMIHSGATGFDGTIAWTKGTTEAPEAGSIVTITATRYEPTNVRCGSKDYLLYFGAENWPDTSNRKKLVGYRSPVTGHFVSLDSIYGGNGFSISFEWPASGNTFNPGKQVTTTGYRGVVLEPVFETVSNNVVVYFSPNGGYFETPGTGAYTTSRDIMGAAYSEIDSSTVLPSSVVKRDGYSLLGWADADGNPLPSTANIEMNQKTYYAQWEARVGEKEIVDGGLAVAWPAPVTSTYNILSTAEAFTGTVSWTAGTNEEKPATTEQPGEGSRVTVTVKKYVPKGTRPATKETLTASAIKEWGGASETQQLSGFMNPDTGTSFSLDSMFDGKGFSFSFIWPKSGATLGTNNLSVAQSVGALVPTCKTVSDMVVTFYHAFPGYFSTPATGAYSSTGKNLYAATYTKLGESLQLPQGAVMRDNYTFTGWFESATSTVLAPEIATADLQGKTYVAQWGNKDSEYYFLSFNKNDDAAEGRMSRQSVPTTLSFTTPEATFVKPGWTVTKWNTEADGTGTSYVVGEDSGAKFQANSITPLYAEWEQDTYELNFATKGGSFEDGYELPEEYHYGEGIISIPDPIKPGYEFLGWTGTGLDEPTFDLTINTDSNDKLNYTPGSATYKRNYTATWRGYTYNVQYYNGDEGKTTEKIADLQTDVVYGERAPIEANNLKDAKPGYHVLKWRMGAPDSTSVSNPTTNIIWASLPEYAPKFDGDTIGFYSIWEPNTYTVTLHDGNSVEAPQTGFTYDADTAIAPAKFTKTAYHIAGWAFTQDAANKREMAFMGATPVIDSVTLASSGHVPAQDGNIDLYAVWEPDDYTVTLTTGRLDEGDGAWDLGTPTALGWTGTWTMSDNGKTAKNEYTVESGKTLSVATTPGGAESSVANLVLLPNPSSKYFTFAGWKVLSGGVTVKTYVYEGKIRYGFVVGASAQHAPIELEAQWTACDYSIEFGNVEHVDGFIAGDLDASSTKTLKAFGGAALADTDGISVSAPSTIDEKRYNDFTRWVTSTDMSGVAGWSEDDGIWWSTGFTITADNADVYFGEDSPNGAEFSVAAEYDLLHFRIFLDLDGGTLGDDKLEKTWVEDGYDFTCESGDVTLPVPVKFGFEPADPNAWLLAGSDSQAFLSQNAAGDYAVAGDSYGNRTYTIQWRGKTDSYTVAVAPSVDESVLGDVPETDAFTARHGQPMTAFASPATIPTRTDGYTFAGYFDTPEETGGKQYFTRELASARAWDKEPNADGTPHILYARWVKNAGETETVIPVTGSEINIVATDTAGTELPAFVATYNGTYRTNSFGRVAVNVDSYELTGSTPENIYANFMDGKEGAEGTRYLLGFRVKSTGSVIAFSDIAMGNSFSFEAKASELLSSMTAPSLALSAGSIEVLYTDKPYDFGKIDPTPGAGDEILAIWNANGGTFAPTNPSAPVTTSTTWAHTVTPYDSGEATRLALPAEPTREGYEFAGWSKAAAHVSDADHAPDGENVMFRPTSIASATYFAHWTARTTDVVFDGNGDDAKTKKTVKGFTFDMVGTKLGSADVIGTALPGTPVRTGYVFTGYFDAKEGGTQYYTSTGAQARAWDKVPSEAGDRLHTLYAQWTRTANTYVTDETNRTAMIEAALDGSPAEGARTVIAGSYDGKMSYSTTKTGVPANYVPQGDDDVTITMYSYEFDTLDVLSRFQENGVAQAEPPYLQGFRVNTTGCFIPLLTLSEGTTVTIECKGSDLTEGVTPASFGLASDKVEPVYGDTPVIPSPTEDYDWPKPYATEVVNTFDACEGRFGEDSTVRFATATSKYMMQLELPDTTPDYNEDEGWSFQGWFTTDGRQVADKDGLTSPAYMVKSATPQTFYAHYTQSRHTIALSLGEAGDYPITGSVENTSAYHGQAVKDVYFPTASTAQGGFYRTGFDFLGWYDADGTPYYVTDAAPAEDKLAYAAVMGTKVESELSLTAKWQRIEYELSFFWNDDTVAEPVYVHAEDDLTGEDAITISYGDEIPDAWVPVPTDPGYQFCGWYASRDFADKSLFVEFDENGPATYAKKYFQTKDGKRVFMPESGAAREMKFYAKWATDGADAQPIAYDVTIEAGEHGSIGGNLPNPHTFTYRYSDADILFSDLQSRFIVADRGWEPSYWMVKDANGQWVRATTDRIPTHSTGNVDLKMVFAPEDGKYRVKLDLGQNQPKANLTVDDLEFWSTDEERPLTRTITVDMEDAIALPSTFRVSGYNGYSFDGWFRVYDDGTVSNGKTEFVVPKNLIEDKANGDATTYTYVAKWSPKSYTITFRQTATSDPSEDVNVTVKSYEDTVTLPAPATVQNGHIFTNWGPSTSELSDAYAGWVSGASIPFAEIAAAVYGLGAGDDNRADLMNNGHVTIYGNWTNALVGAEVPLYVNMLVDPYQMTVEVADTYWIGTTSTAPVQVESLTYKLAADEGEVPGTAKLLAFSDGSLGADDFALTVRGDADGETLSIPLGTEKVVTGLAAHGFRAFTADDPLLLKYGLTLPGTTDLAKLSELVDPKLFNAFYIDEFDEVQHVSYPLAYLYYTISTVPATE